MGRAIAAWRLPRTIELHSPDIVTQAVALAVALARQKYRRILLLR
jgi:hypothetical protein